jgi:hypothetical protein
MRDLRRVVLIMSVRPVILPLSQKKGKLMKKDNSISIYDVFSDEDTTCSTCIGLALANPSTLCDTHFFEWAEEKAYGELERSEDYFHLI